MAVTKKRRKPEKRVAWQRNLDRTLKGAVGGARASAALTPARKKKILLEVAREIEKREKQILRANAKDLKRSEEMKLPAAMMDRLRLTPARIKQMAGGVRVVARLREPVGSVMANWTRPNGLKISKVSVPLGVILIIYESRPNVTVECASLCLKSGNTVILRGGKEAFDSNRILSGIFSEILKKQGVPQTCVSFVKTTDREAVNYLLHRDDVINLVIPRGGASLIRKVVEVSRVPVIKHYQGVCHVYIDAAADLKKALAIAFNAKMQRTGVCNAMETLVVHQKVAGRLLPLLGEELRRASCEVLGDRETRRWIDWAKPARKDDFGREFLDKVLAIRVVRNLDEAIAHIQDYGSGHTDAIVSRDKRAIKAFSEKIDSSSVMINASTRFADGFEYGFGAEIGISTDKIHARGPMGLEGLTTYKYLVEGNGQIRS